MKSNVINGLERLKAKGNGGKSPGTQVQHTLSIGTKGTEFRRFLASKCGTVRAITKSAWGFALLPRADRDDVALVIQEPAH